MIIDCCLCSWELLACVMWRKRSMGAIMLNNSSRPLNNYQSTSTVPPNDFVPICFVCLVRLNTLKSLCWTDYIFNFGLAMSNSVAASLPRLALSLDKSLLCVLTNFLFYAVLVQFINGSVSILLLQYSRWEITNGKSSEIIFFYFVGVNAKCSFIRVSTSYSYRSFSTSH